MEEDIYKKSTIILKKLLEYGFVTQDGIPTYKYLIKDKNLEIIITYESDKIHGKIIDKDLGEEYLSYRIANPTGEFANSIKDEYIRLLEDIKEKCTISKNYISSQANRICNLIKEKYNDTPEYLWDDDGNSVFRNKSNKKWYGIIMYINKNKIDQEDKMVEVMNVKLPPEQINSLLKHQGYYRAYHMNKKYWITFILDDTIDDDELMNLIDISHNYTVETNEWVIPANPIYWDVASCFNNSNIIEWKQPKNINIGDAVYIYVGKPYSCILYKCTVKEKDIEPMYPWANKVMILELQKKYPEDKYTFEIIKMYDLKAIRGARRMPIKLINKIREDEEND